VEETPDRTLATTPLIDFAAMAVFGVLTTSL
jgi:hypothetical protein